MHSPPREKRGEQGSDAGSNCAFNGDFCFKGFHVWDELILWLSRFRKKTCEIKMALRFVGLTIVEGARSQIATPGRRGGTFIAEAI